MASLSLFGEMILMSVLVVTILGFAVGGFNQMYGQNNTLGFTDSSGSQTAFFHYASNTSQSKLTGGEVNFNSANGLTLGTTWEIVTDFFRIVWQFISGGWIENVVGQLGLGESGVVLGLVLRILFLLAVVFSALYGLFRVML